jgi:hypothetical protein
MELLHRERCSITRALSTYLLKSPEKKPPLQVPLTEPLHREKCSISRALYISLKVPNPEPSLHISRSPQKRNTPSRFPLWSPYIKKDAPSPEPS